MRLPSGGGILCSDIIQSYVRIIYKRGEENERAHENISKSEVLILRDQVLCQPGQVVSKTLAQNNALSITLFAFDKDEEISTHASGGDAFVTCLEGVGK